MWVELAAGTISGSAADALFLHASECQDCAAALRRAIELFTEDDETEAPPAMKSKRGRDRVDEPAGGHPGRTSSWRLWAIAASVALAVAIGSVYIHNKRLEAGEPLHLLASAYTAGRQLELRIPTAAYSPLRVTRGGAGTATQAPAELLRGQMMINQHRQSGNETPLWLHAEARAELLWWRYDDAIRSFEAAADSGASSTEFWIDYASAYFERAEARSAPHDYTMAIELLSKALKSEPENPAALFNRAIVYSKLKDFDPAIVDLEHYLRVDDKGGWADEARSRLADLSASRSRLFGAQHIPLAFAAEAGLESALTGQLEATIQASVPAKASLWPMAKNLVSAHHDYWLIDALSLRGDRNDSRAIRSLSAMARVRASVSVGKYSDLRSEVAWLRQAQMSGPLAVWRDFEFLYRASHGGNFAACPASASLLKTCRNRRYVWFGVQVYLEQSTCQTGVNRLEAAEESVRRALQIAHDSHFRTAQLRTRGFLSSHYVNEGRYREAFRVDYEGLDQIVKDGYPAKRAHEFYNGMMRAAESMERWNSAFAAAWMARQAAKSAHYPMLEAVALSKQADFARAAGDVAGAGQLYSEVLQAFKRQPSVPGADVYRDFAETGLLESRHDLGALRAMRDRLPEKGDVFLESALDLALARVALDLGDFGEAERNSQKLIVWLANPSVNGSPQERVLIRKQLSAASILLTRAKLLRGDEAGAYASWQRFLYDEARLLGGAVGPPETPVRVRDGTGLVTIADLGVKVAVWLRTSNALVFAWAGSSRESLLRDVRQLRRLCSTPTSSPEKIQPLANHISDEIFAPVLRRGRGFSRIYVQASGELGGFPVAMLAATAGLTPAFSPYPLRPASGDGHGAAFISGSSSDPELESSLPPLVDTAQELRTEAAMYKNSTMLTGRSATPAALDRAAAAASLFHFSGHAIPSEDGIALVVSGDSGDPRPAAQRGLWRVSAASRMVADLTVLSACSTAMQEETQTVLPGRLAEAALLAGSRNVVATLWDVDSRAAALFNGEFYRLLQKGYQVEQAVAAAASFLRTQNGFEHPNYWASFVVYQNTNQEIR
jgi:tetratricopeptide (TPR) repeat protein